MIEEFSGSYYLGRMFVRPAPDDRARLGRRTHERLNERLYASGEGLQRLDAPVVMKLDNAHFPVHGDEGVPADTLEVPEEFVDEYRRSATEREVFIAKADRARQLLRYSGAYTPPDAT